MKIDQRKLYNKIYYTLSIDYGFFLKKIQRCDDEFLLRLLKREVEKEDGEKIFLTKESLHFKEILKIFKGIIKKIKNNVNALVSTERLEKFVNNVEKELKNNMSIKKAFKKGLYDITENEIAYQELNAIRLSPVHLNQELLSDPCLLILLWTLYSYEKFSDVFNEAMREKCDDLKNEEFFVYTYPLRMFIENNTFNEIRFNETLWSYFQLFLKTNEGRSVLLRNEKYNKAINEDMAFHLIKNQKIKLMELLQDKKNELFVKRINTVMKKIANESAQLVNLKQGKSLESNWILDIFGVKELPIETYLREYIPDSLFGIIGGEDSSKGLYSITSALKFYESAMMHQAKVIWSYSISKEQSLEMKKIYNPWFHNVFSQLAVPPIFGLWGKSFDPQKIKELPCYSNFSDEKMKSVYWNNPISYTLGDQIFKLQNMPGITGSFINYFSFFPKAFGFVMHGSYTAYDLYNKYRSIQSIMKQYKNIRIHYQYFFRLKKIILYSKQLINIFIELYKENNIDEEEIIPEIIQMKNIIKNKKKDGLLNKILSWSNKNINVCLSTIYNFFVPGIWLIFILKNYMKV